MDTILVTVAGVIAAVLGVFFAFLRGKRVTEEKKKAEGAVAYWETKEKVREKVADSRASGASWRERLLARNKNKR
jgi:hypothetical protein